MRKIVNQINKGFNLLELLAAVAIVGILLGIAVPTYREYQIKAYMVDVIATLNSLLDPALQQYVNAGTIPTSVRGYATGVVTAYTDLPCISFVYYDDGATWTNVGQGAMVQAIVSENCASGIQGFAAGENGAFNRVTMAFTVNGDSVKRYCGAWVADDTAVPLEYLPAGCQDADFSTTVTG